LFVKSWNEWAEGNYMEPDAEWGDQRITVLGDVLREASMQAARDAGRSDVHPS
jgi:hypothetical protein